MRQVAIYALSDPRSGIVYYVGRTWQPLVMRLQQHVWRSRTGRDTCGRAVWIKSLWEQGVKPAITPLEMVDEADWPQAEWRWIVHFRSAGAPLVNEAAAGAGGTRSHIIEWTPELDARLGVEADSVIAEELGVTRKAVSYRRRVLKIPASFNRARNTPPPPRGGWNRKELPPEIIARLGTEPDYKLGEELGVVKTVIARARRARGIKPYAELTGNTGRYAKGNYPARWKKDH